MCMTSEEILDKCNKFRIVHFIFVQSVKVLLQDVKSVRYDYRMN